PSPHRRPDARPADRGWLGFMESIAGLSHGRVPGRCPRRNRLRRDFQDQGRRTTCPRCRTRDQHHRRLRSPDMKKLINDPADVITEALRGMAIAHPELRIDHTNRIVYRGDAPISGKVGLISGGGSGHEPLHGGFVGRGMLDAACAGEVFTSPVPDQMLEATKNVDGGAGVLHIVKNYTGDVMNFEMAAELADAE